MKRMCFVAVCFCLLLALLALSAVAEAPAPKENGVIPAEAWADMYPNQYASLMNEADNTIRVDYGEQYPDLAVLYEGTPFSQDYTSAIGHSYSLADVAETTRPHALANCLTCKTPDYTALVNSLGTEAYALPFDEVYAQCSETVTCYSCHGNTPGEPTVMSGYVTDALGSDAAAAAAPQSLTCAQCHVEYYFTGENKEVKLPYTSLDTMTPDAILAFYNETGFTDYTNPSTGTQMIKVQHPEYETFMGEGSIHASNMNCATCHMGAATADDGAAYTSHHLTSPLDNSGLIASSCSACHQNLVSEVHAIQAATEERTNAVGAKMADMAAKLAGAVSGGQYTDEELDAVRALHRDAMFYWDFVFVENAEGAHNSSLTNDCLDKAEALTEQALALLVK